MRWLEVFIANFKLKYSESRESLRGRDSTIGILRRSLSMLHQTCTAMVVESNYRECELQLNYAKIYQLTTNMVFVRSQNDVVQSCISCGDVLLTTYQNAIQELIMERESLFHTFQCTSFIEIDILRHQISQITLEMNKLSSPAMISKFLAARLSPDYTMC